MLAKISPFRILRDHFHTLKDYGSTSYSISDIVVAYPVPLILAVVAWQFVPYLTDGFVNTVLDSVSIMAALLLNLQVLMIGVAEKIGTSLDPQERRDPLNRARFRALQDANYNISYSILVCLILIVSLLLTYVPRVPLIVAQAGSVWVYFWIANFIVTLLRILQLVHVSLKDQLKRLFDDV